MKRTYLLLAILGFIAPNVLVFIESYETGNILLYANPIATFSGMFANRISTIFAIDLLVAVVIFMVWTYTESRRLGIKKIGVLWLITMMFGLAGAFPYFLYLLETKRSDPTRPNTGLES